MFRLLGIVIGSVISIGGILLVLGIPQLDFSSFESDQARFDEAVRKLREKQPAIEEAARTAAGTEAGGAVAASGPSPGDAATPEVPADQPGAQEAAAAPAEPDTWQAAAAADPPDTEPEEKPLANELEWQDFWNPFRSEIAARGFVSQLERVTGLDYRIVKVKAGEYQVGFAYHGDDERRLHLQQIADATGLDLPET